MSTTKKDDYYHVGLTDDEVLQSREKNGVNLLTPPKRPSLWKLYLEKFEDPVVRVLLVDAVFSLIISIIEHEYAETIGIIAAILSYWKQAKRFLPTASCWKRSPCKGTNPT